MVNHQVSLKLNHKHQRMIEELLGILKVCNTSSEVVGFSLYCCYYRHTFKKDGKTPFELQADSDNETAEQRMIRLYHDYKEFLKKKDNKNLGA